MTQVQTNVAATLVTSAASAAVVEASHAHPNGNGSLATRDRNDFVRVVLCLNHVRPFPSFHLWCFHLFPVVQLDRLWTEHRARAWHLLSFVF